MIFFLSNLYLIDFQTSEGTKIGNDKKELEEFANKYLVPFTNMLLLLHKIDPFPRISVLGPREQPPKYSKINLWRRQR